MAERDSAAEGWEYVLDLHLSKIVYDNGYWVAIRVTKVPRDDGRPHGSQYALSLHDQNDDRVLGYDNAHGVDVATGPAQKSKRPKAYDHIDRRGARSKPYEFTTPFKLLEDFFADVDAILKTAGVP